MIPLVNPPSFWKDLFFSFLAHSILLIVFFSKTGNHSQNKPLLLQPHQPPALRVDWIALPDKRFHPVIPHPASEQPQNHPKSPQLPDPKPAKTLLASPVANHLKFQQRKQKQLAQLEERNLSTLQKFKAQALKLSGNQRSAGSLFGNPESKTASHDYYSILEQHLKSHWFLPSWLHQSPLKARVHLWIFPNGRIRKMEIQAPSGNPLFDHSVQQALEDSQPYPPPPEDLIPLLQEQGIFIGFPL